MIIGLDEMKVDAQPWPSFSQPKFQRCIPSDENIFENGSRLGAACRLPFGTDDHRVSTTKNGHRTTKVCGATIRSRSVCRCIGANAADIFVGASHLLTTVASRGSKLQSSRA